MLLMMIPVLNILLLIIRAGGGCRKVNKRNFSRAVLVRMAIGVIRTGVFYILGVSLSSDKLDELKEPGTTPGNN